MEKYILVSINCDMTMVIGDRFRDVPQSHGSQLD